MKKFITIFFVTSCLLSATYSQQHACDACQDDSCLSDDVCGPQENCDQYQSVPITDDQINEILSKHNELRNKVANGEQSGQPSAANMNQLEWDDELANIAQCYANQCEFEHMRCDLTGDRGTFGQNIYASFTSDIPDDLDYAAGVQSWYDEVSDFPSDLVDNYQFGGSYGHYSQVVWAETTRVGCGSVVFYDGQWWNHIFFCNYYTPGNYGNEPVYEQGEPASDCENGPSSDYPALCQS